MARPLRLVLPNSLYHVIARGNERKAVFRDDDDRRRYLGRLAHYRERDGFLVLAYCLMGNHIHLAIETGEVGLPKTMAGLQSSYTQAFNRKHRRVGHLFQGRYKAMLVDKDAYGQALIRYIHRNPVEAGIVRRDSDYEWSSAKAWLRGGGPEWLDVKAGMRLFGPTPRRAMAVYQTFRSDARGASYDTLPSVGQQVRGGDEFADVVRRHAGNGQPPRWKHVSIESVARDVAEEAGVKISDLKSPGRGRQESRARALVAARAQELGGISISRTARYFERDDSSLLRAVERLKGEGK